MGAAAIPPDTPRASPTPSAPPSASEGPAPAFTFSAPAFSSTNAVRLDGSKDAGSSIVVAPLAAGGPPLCTIAASSSTDFSCVAVIASGGAITVSAVETLDGVASAPLSVTMDVLGAPTIEGSPGYITSGIVSGYALAGSTVSTVLDSGEIGCRSLTTDVGYWSCSLAVPSGPAVVRAKQSRADLGAGASSSLSEPFSVVVDREAPPSAEIVSPAAGSRVTSTETSFSGTGELAAGDREGIVDLYLDNVPACQTAVVGGFWSCSLRGVSAGAHWLRVIQRDAAGNFSAPSTPIIVYFGAKTGTTAPVPAPSRSPSTSPPSGAPGAPSRPAPPPPAPPPADRPLGGFSDAWGAPTTFGAAIPTLAASVSNGNWLLAPVLSLAFVVLVALPLRLLAGALRGRFRFPSLQFTGRNRSRLHQSPPPTTTNPWVAWAVPIAVVAGLIVIAGGVDDQVRYLRLIVAVVLGLGVLNLVGVAITIRLGSRWQSVSGRLRFVPLLLFAALLAAAVSRAVDIHPPVIAGVLIGVGFTTAAGARAQAIVSLVEIGSVTALAALAWLLHGLFVSAAGFLGLLTAETLATVALAGLGSVVVLVLPIATLPGRAIFEWSRPVWLATVTVVALIGSVVILGGAGASFPTLGAVLVGGAFAALSVAVWGWLRFVDPLPAPEPAPRPPRAGS
jgi:hypothetical protein